MEKNGRLIFKKGNRETFCIEKEHISIGSYPGNDIIIEGDKFISGYHAVINFSEGTFSIKDNNSTNGTFVNNRKIDLCELNSGDIITLGDSEIEFVISSVATSRRIERNISKSVIIGRNPESNIFLPQVQVSWHHATVTYSDGEFFIEDNKSDNWVYVNGKKITRVKLKRGDIIQICNFRLFFDGKNIEYLSEEGKIRLDALSLRKTVSEDKVILQDVSFSIDPCEFISIVGTSGAGKSTLMKALCGVQPPDSGDVFINGTSFYDNLNFFRSSLGYVPQDDIVHEELSVYKALYYAASLRLPEDTKKNEIDELIDRVLCELEMEERKHTQIKKLSGGQRKRVSIGVELLTRPTLFFLDEPTSGLDPATETKMMALMRKLADQGRTIILVTHVTKNVKFCDKVVFLARGGYLVFFGPPDEALNYFQVQEFTEIYNKIESTDSPFQWAEKFRNSVYYKEGVFQKLKVADSFRDKKNKIPPSLWAAPARGASHVRQFFILSSRYAEIIGKDFRNLAIIFLQAPIIAVLLALVFKRDIFDADPKVGDGNAAMIVLFFLVCVSVWFGTSNAAREIIKEKSIYERERMINLQIIPYILSKFIILAIICGIQCAILLGIVAMGVKFPDRGNYLFYLDVYCCIFLTALSGVGMGLLVSSIVSTVDKATSIVPILLIPQLIFSGAIIPFKNMDKLSKFISNFAVSRWALGLLGALVSINDILPSHMKDMLKETFDINIQKHFNILSVLFLLFIGFTCFFQKRKDIR